MSNAYKNKNNFAKSILCAKETLQLELDKTNEDFVNIARCYTQLMDLCPEQSKNYIEEIRNISEKHDLSISSKRDIYQSIGCYYFLQKYFSNARYYYELSLKYQLMYVPPCYLHLPM